MTGKPKIFIATPSARDWKVGFGTSMIHLTAHLMSKVLPQYDKEGKLTKEPELDGIYIACQPASLLSVSREMLLQRALEGNFTHILWIDDDTQFSEKAVDLMLSRDKDYVALNFCRRTFPLSFTAHELGTMSPIDSSKRTGIEEVHQVGLGMALIRLECLKNIPMPRFQVQWNHATGTYIGEDHYFCQLLKMAGVNLYVDHDASVLARHIGDFGYTFPQVPHGLKEKTEITLRGAA